VGYALDNVAMTVASAPGTGAISLGSAVSGYQTFAAAGALSGQLVPYAIQDAAGAFEYGRGTYSSSGPTLTRTTILGSSNGGSAINATAAAIISCPPLAEDAVSLGNVSAALQSATTINDTTTPTTGGVTLANQVLAAGSVWRIKAMGQYTTASSATARHMIITPYWGSTALTALNPAGVKTSATTTYNWQCEFMLVGTSTSALLLNAWSLNEFQGGSTGAVVNDTFIAPTSNTGLPTGLQTIDLRFDMSSAVTGDSITVGSVSIERIQ
jgi:hypothetical protein